MKIKTITCHKVYNAGASLQEYALLEFLRQLGHQAEAIHYKPAYLSRHFDFMAVDNPQYSGHLIKPIYLLAKFPQRLIALIKKKKYDSFHEQYIPTGQKKYTDNEKLKSDLPQADAYICGSDQIWNPLYPNGTDPAFYLDFVPMHKKRISYAASFATDKLPAGNFSFVSEKINNIQSISVREISALKILQDLGIHRGVQVLDPVFLLDRSFWEQKFIMSRTPNYIFIYDFDSNIVLQEAAEAYAKKNQLKIYAFNRNIRYATRNYWKEGPIEFINLIFNAKAIFTNSFHALAFSLIFNKEVFVFNRFEAINTRMRDMLKIIDEENRLISMRDYKIDPMDYSKINSVVALYRKKSRQFLTDALTND